MGNAANSQRRSISMEGEAVTSAKHPCRPPMRLGKTKVKVHSATDVTESECQTETSLKQEPENLSEEEKILLSSTWIQVEKDAERIGAVTFVNLFEMHPDMKDEFIPFKSIEVHDERFNRILRNHGLRVLSTVGKMIHRLNEEEKMIGVLTDVGTRHGDYNAKASLIDVMCPHFVKAIEGTLGERWTPNIEAAYRHLFHILSYYMKSALTLAQQAQVKPTTKQRKS